jgi:splicing factor 3B subunit 3
MVISISIDPYMSYIVISFINATLVLSIGETVVEVNDSGILESTPTLSVSLLGDNSLLQVHANGLRHIRSDKRFNEWKPPGKVCSSTHR